MLVNSRGGASCEGRIKNRSGLSSLIIFTPSMGIWLVMGLVETLLHYSCSIDISVPPRSRLGCSECKWKIMKQKHWNYFKVLKPKYPTRGRSWAGSWELLIITLEFSLSASLTSPPQQQELNWVPSDQATAGWVGCTKIHKIFFHHFVI